MSHVLVIGGFTEGRASLAPVAHEAVRQGFGDDAEVLTLPKAVKMGEERLWKLIAGAHLLTHSLGLAGVPDARGRHSDAELPRQATILAAPEPRGIDRLAIMATGKTLDHVFGATENPRRSHLRVVADNAGELLAHPFLNRELVRTASGFSTLKQLERGSVAATGLIASFVMEEDAFYPQEDGLRDPAVIQLLAERGMLLADLPGSHDELLVNPRGVLHAVAEARAASVA